MPWILLFFVAMAFASSKKDAHLVLEDSSGHHWAAVRLTLAESLQITDFGPTHMQSSTWARLRAFGEFTSKFRFTSTATVYTDIANRNYPANYYEPDLGIPYNTQDSGRRTWDYIMARSEYQPTEYLQLSTGLDYLREGPSFRNPIAFRGEQNFFRPWQDSSTRNPRPAPFLFAGFKMDLAWLAYTQTTAKTMARRGLDRYLHTHRLTANLPMHSEFSLFETEVYGTTVEPAGSNPNRDGDSLGRTMEWLYAMPFVPYFFAQHYIGDRDNGNMGLTGVFRGIPNLETYFELMLDDSKSPLSLLDESWWGNKWGLSTGWKYGRTWRSMDLELRFEWTRIEPWVYTHHLGASHQYTHYGQLIGSDLGPNSQEFYTHLQMAYEPIRIRLSFSSVDKDTALGSQVSDIHTPADATTKKFLNPSTTHHYLQAGIETWFQWNEWYWINMGYWYYRGSYEGVRAEGSIGITW